MKTYQSMLCSNEVQIYVFGVYIYWPDMHKPVIITNQMLLQDKFENKSPQISNISQIIAWDQESTMKSI